MIANFILISSLPLSLSFHKSIFSFWSCCLNCTFEAETKMSLYERLVDMPAEASSSIEGPRTRQLKLYRAALNGDWAVAKRIYDVYKGEIGVPISKRGDTALHVAAAAERTDFVKELVKIMNPKDIDKQNKAESTALFYAAASGNVELAKETMKGEKGIAIAMVPDGDGMLPIVRAASLGHKKMVNYLYEQIEGFLSDEDCIELLIKLIESDLYDDAMQLLEKRPRLATKRARNEKTALHVLAQKNLTTPKRGIFGRCLNIGAQDEENKEAIELVKRLWGRVVLLSDDEIKELIRFPTPQTFDPEKHRKVHVLYIDAAEHGNVHFLYILIREFPDLILAYDQNNHTIFHFAVLNRQEDIFKLLYEIDSTKDLILDSWDNEGNNILHLAGKLPTQDRLDVVSGAALQMQRELLWFQEVKNVVPQWFAEAKNKAGLTPREFFSKEHKELKEKGEIWMKDTASSCMIVATLIAGAVFAAFLSVPGGTNASTGLPFFLHKVSFKIFAVADVISLVFAAVSIVNFLSMVAPRYAEEDFLSLLPTKLIFGLATLFISLAALMVVLCATTFILFEDGNLWIAILATVLASMLVIVFIKQHFQLFNDVLRSTFAPNYLIHKGGSRLFYKEGETSKHLKKSKFETHGRKH